MVHLEDTQHGTPRGYPAWYTTWYTPGCTTVVYPGCIGCTTVVYPGCIGCILDYMHPYHGVYRVYTGLYALPTMVPGVHTRVYSTLYTPGYTTPIPWHAGVLRCTVLWRDEEALGSKRE